MGVAILGSVSDSATWGDLPVGGGAASFGAEGDECGDVAGDASGVGEGAGGVGEATTLG